jgi:hypothetical protein
MRLRGVLGSAFIEILFWGEAGKGSVGSEVIVQHDDGTPTRPRNARLFTDGILGRDAWFAFMRW